MAAYDSFAILRPITALETANASLNALITSLQGDVGQNTADILTIGTQATSHGNSITALQATDASLATAITGVDTRVQVLEAAPPVEHPLIAHGVNLNQVLITGTTSETPLYTFTQPANTWTAGSELRVLMAGLMTGNRGTKRLRIRINGTTYFNRNLSANTRHPWNIRASLMMRPGHEAVLVVHLDYHTRRFEHSTVVLPLDPTVVNTMELTGRLNNGNDSISGEMAAAETFSHPVI